MKVEIKSNADTPFVTANVYLNRDEWRVCNNDIWNAIDPVAAKHGVTLNDVATYALHIQLDGNWREVFRRDSGELAYWADTQTLIIVQEREDSSEQDRSAGRNL